MSQFEMDRVVLPSLDDGSGPPRRSTISALRSNIFGRFILGVWLPIVLVLIWYLLTLGSTSLFDPKMTDVLSTLREDFLSSQVTVNLLPSLQTLFVGLVIGLAAGIIFGYLIGLNKLWRDILMPIVDMFRSIPALILIPVFLILIGFNYLSEETLIAWAAMWPAMLSTIDGVAGLEPGYRDAARIIHLTRFQRVFLLRIPAALPQIAVGVKIGISIGIALMVGFEFFAGSRGIGRYLQTAQKNFNFRDAYAGAIASGILGYLITGVYLFFERRVFLKWHFEMRKGSNGDK